MVPGLHGEIGVLVSPTAGQQETELVTFQHPCLEELTVLAITLRRKHALEMIALLQQLLQQLQHLQQVQQVQQVVELLPHTHHSLGLHLNNRGINAQCTTG